MRWTRVASMAYDLRKATGRRDQYIMRKTDSMGYIMDDYAHKDLPLKEGADCGVLWPF